MLVLINRSASLLVFLTYIAAGFARGGDRVALVMTILLILPLACIWFPRPLGDYAGTICGQIITSSTPAFLVCAGGWLVLVGVPLIASALAVGT
jgi:hypothetical protein